jgi:hypothetical protein
LAITPRRPGASLPTGLILRSRQQRPSTQLTSSFSSSTPLRKSARAPSLLLASSLRRSIGSPIVFRG